LEANDESLSQLHALAPASGKKLKSYLEGLPAATYVLTLRKKIFRHFEMAGHLGQDSVQLDLRRGRHWYELTLVTTDRPFLFANVAGALAAWGMNIVKANAFSNQAGVVVDTFFFTDSFRTLELNLPEWERFKVSIAMCCTVRLIWNGCCATVCGLTRLLSPRSRSIRGLNLMTAVLLPAL